VILPSPFVPHCAPMTTNVGQDHSGPKPLLSTGWKPVRSKALRQKSRTDRLALFSQRAIQAPAGPRSFGFRSSLATRVLEGLGQGRFG